MNLKKLLIIAGLATLASCGTGSKKYLPEQVNDALINNKMAVFYQQAVTDLSTAIERTKQGYDDKFKEKFRKYQEKIETEDNVTKTKRRLKKWNQILEIIGNRNEPRYFCEYQNAKIDDAPTTGQRSVLFTEKELRELADSMQVLQRKGDLNGIKLLSNSYVEKAKKRLPREYTQRWDAALQSRNKIELVSAAKEINKYLAGQSAVAQTSNVSKTASFADNAFLNRIKEIKKQTGIGETQAAQTNNSLDNIIRYQATIGEIMALGVGIGKTQIYSHLCDMEKSINPDAYSDKTYRQSLQNIKDSIVSFEDEVQSVEKIRATYDSCSADQNDTIDSRFARFYNCVSLVETKPVAREMLRLLQYVKGYTTQNGLYTQGTINTEQYLNDVINSTQKTKIKRGGIKTVRPNQNQNDENPTAAHQTPKPQPAPQDREGVQF